MFNSVYFDSIRAYLPDEAKAILNDQIPKIREAVAADLDDFGKKLGAKIQKDLADAFAARQTAIEDAGTTLKALIDGVATKAPAELGDAVKKLKDSLDAYEKQWKDLGTSAREVALAAVKSAGIPLPV